MCAEDSGERRPARKSVPDWYRGRSVLVTGATGFLGKAIVEKLLRSCPGVATIYILVRHKRGQDPKKRAEAYAASAVFSRLRVEQPDFARHLSLVSGDLAAPSFTLAEDYLSALQRDVSIVFHCAASVRFDDSLRFAVHTNVLGTKRALQLAEQLPQLQAFVYISTSFCHCDQPVLEEKAYPAVENPEKVLDIVSWMDDDMLQAVTPKLLRGLPNTYGFSKNLTEQLVTDYARKLPIVLARPSIVIPSWKEPEPGWADNLNGPIGISIAGGKGILRVIHGSPDIHADVFPVDCTANAIIVLAWHMAENKPENPYVCNLTNGQDNPVTWKWINDTMHTLGTDSVPLEGGLWYPGAMLTSSHALYRVLSFILHFIPAYLIDFLIFLSGRKPFLVYVQKRIESGQKMLSYYMLHEWYFDNKKLHTLAASLRPEDRETFFFDISVINWDEYLKEAIIGTKKFLLKEDVNDMSKARRHMKRLLILHYATLTIFYGLLVWLLYSWSEPLLDFLEFVLWRIATMFHGAPVVRVLAEEIPDSPDVLSNEESSAINNST